MRDSTLMEVVFLNRRIVIMSELNCLSSITIKGYRSIENTYFVIEPLQVLVGANGTGKSCFFEFLRFIRDACYHEIPPEIVRGTIGQQIFHKPGPDKLGWCAEVTMPERNDAILYEGELIGPIGSPKITCERVIAKNTFQKNSDADYIFMDFKNGKGVVREPGDKNFRPKQWDLKKTNQLGLGAITDSTLATLFNFREYIRGWRFYDSFIINNEKIRRPVPASQEALLHEDFGNLSAILLNLMTEQPESFYELKSLIKLAIPGFKDLNVKARGGPGEVLAFWGEQFNDTDLSLADLSDGTLRFIVWATLCVMPYPPTLICIDEPDQGVHPRTLPIIAGLLEKMSKRTQVILATHDSFFLSQFDTKNIGVMKKEFGNSVFIRASDSKTLTDNLEEFGHEELEKMHRSDELDMLSKEVLV